MKLKQILLFTLCITFFACNTEPVNNPEEEQETTDNTLVKKIIYNKDTADEYIEIFYYDGNKLISVDAGDGDKSVYTYENDNLVKDEYFDGGILNASVTLEYNADETLASFIETFFEDSGLDDRQYKHVVTYNNDGTITNEIYGNYDNTGFELDYIETIILDGENIAEISDEDGFKTSIEYDDKNNAFKNINAIEILNILSENEFGALIYGNTKNIISYLESDSSTSDNYNDSYEYTYNEKNYPISSIYTSKYGDDIENIETIEYFYE